MQESLSKTRLRRVSAVATARAEPRRIGGTSLPRPFLILAPRGTEFEIVGRWSSSSQVGFQLKPAPVRTDAGARGEVQARRVHRRMRSRKAERMSGMRRWKGRWEIPNGT